MKFEYKKQLNITHEGSHVCLSETEQGRMMQCLLDNAERPKIVCLCGSTKFKKEFKELNKKLTLDGIIVLTVGFFAHAEKDYVSDEQKLKLDQLHFRKIDIADYIYVVNVGGYIGKSTMNEIEYARSISKGVAFLE